MVITVAIKKINNVYDSALLVDNRFQRSTVQNTVPEVMEILANPILLGPHNDDDEIVITAIITPRGKN